LTVGRSLMRLDVQSLLALDLHGTVHDDGLGRGHGRRAMLDQDRRDGFKDSIFFLLGHRRFLLGELSTSKKTSTTRLCNSRRRCVPALGSQARLGQAHTGDLQKQCCTNLWIPSFNCRQIL
jgi:hypothetical protein